MTGFESIVCDHDGCTLAGLQAQPTPSGDGSSTSGTVMMFPGATGPGESFRAAMLELASEGYRVIAADMYGRDADLSTPESAGAHFTDLLATPERLRERVLAWFERVSALPGADAERIAAIGYCFGGKCVLELARSGARLSSVTSFHGLLTTHAPARPGEVRTQVNVWTGGRDPYAPLADFDALREEFSAAGADLQATVFTQAQHSFTDPDHHGFADGIAYDAMAHAIAWEGTKTRLRLSIGAMSQTTVTDRQQGERIT